MGPVVQTFLFRLDKTLFTAGYRQSKIGFAVDWATGETMHELSPVTRRKKQKRQPLAANIATISAGPSTATLPRASWQSARRAGPERER